MIKVEVIMPGGNAKEKEVECVQLDAGNLYVCVGGKQYPMDDKALHAQVVSACQVRVQKAVAPPKKQKPNPPAAKPVAKKK